MTKSLGWNPGNQNLLYSQTRFMVEVLPSVARENAVHHAGIAWDGHTRNNEPGNGMVVVCGGSNWFIDFPPEDNLLRYFEGRLLLASLECFNSSMLTTEKSLAWDKSSFIRWLPLLAPSFLSVNKAGRLFPPSFSFLDVRIPPLLTHPWLKFHKNLSTEENPPAHFSSSAAPLLSYKSYLE